MNLKCAFAVALFIGTAAAGNAFADDITVDNSPSTSTSSRAQVQAELAQFQRSGSDPWSLEFDPMVGFVSHKTRAQVVAELVAARNELAASAFSGEYAP
jgi:hypothetical protein